MRAGAVGRGATGIALALSIVVWGAALVPRLVPGAGPSGLTGLAGLALLSGVVVSVLLRRRSNESASSRIGLAQWWPALLAPVLGTGMLFAATVRSGYPFWVMQGDMVWNTAQSLFVHQDGGVLASAHPNPAPLTNILFAMSFGPGATPSLGAVFTAQATTTLVIATIVSLLGGLYTAQRAQGLHVIVRGCLVFAVGWLPFVGALLGAVTTFGHANVLTSYLVLWLAWAVFSERELRPLTRAAVLVLLTTITAASWAPLAVVPAGLALFAALSTLTRAGRVEQSGAQLRGWTMVALSGAQLLAYGLVVTLPDLRREGEALSQNGSVLMISPLIAVLIFALIALVAIVLWWRSWSIPALAGTRKVSLAVLGTLVLSVPAIGYLLLQRADMESWWGYYPVKYVTLAAMAMCGVLIAAIASVIPRDASVFKQSLIAATGLPLFLLPVLAPFNWTPGFSALTPGIQAIRQALTEEQSAGIDQLIRAYDTDPGGRALMFDDSAWVEQAANGYLIQLSTERSTDPVRAYAYVPDRLNDAQLCAVVEDLWQGDATIYTTSAATEAAAYQRLSACGAAAESIEIVSLSVR